jgi:hypothetical protein
MNQLRYAAPVANVIARHQIFRMGSNNTIWYQRPKQNYLFTVVSFRCTVTVDKMNNLFANGLATEA